MLRHEYKFLFAYFRNLLIYTLSAILKLILEMFVYMFICSRVMYDLLQVKFVIIVR